MAKRDIKVALIGVGNCASSLVKGVEYYKDVRAEDPLIPGLMHNSLGGYMVKDIKFVTAFDVDKKKVGKDLSKAVFSKPNCTVKFSDVPEWGVDVKKGPVLDGVSDTTRDKFTVDAKQRPVDVAKELERSEADVAMCYLPVGSEEAARFYAKECVKAGVAFINAIPVFICSTKE
ncbi:MAG: inositol-3-phosphate synthase, partial [Candidatus Altiarchaeota archaeon]|nr:inositol-3-phosphate synthase [Candidatus Altiarchaeota archaeon]